MTWPMLRDLMFRLDPETAHNLAMSFIQRGLVPYVGVASDPVKVFGVTFPNRLGLAAGFDKNAVAINHWHRLGFGFVEIGTVTRHGQPGNPKPRLFRLKEDRAILNRMGFNNEGADAVSARIANSKPSIPVGINLGKSKVTPIEDASADYLYSFRKFLGKGDYFVVNVSSPNTPGLRSLQEKGPLKEILGTLRAENATVPLLVKVAPDLSEHELCDVLEVASDAGLQGIIATNTTLSRVGLTQDPEQAGGLSGAPLTTRANDVLEFLAKNRPSGMALIGVGGVMNRDDYRRKLDLGADLVQVYSGWIYAGPRFASELLRE